MDSILTFRSFAQIKVSPLLILGWHPLLNFSKNICLHNIILYVYDLMFPKICISITRWVVVVTPKAPCKRVIFPEIVKKWIKHQTFINFIGKSSSNEKATYLSQSLSNYFEMLYNYGTSLGTWLLSFHLQDFVWNLIFSF